jgi:hypothetical protein
MTMFAFDSPHARRARPAGTERRSAFLMPYSEFRSWGRLDLPDPVHVARTGIARYRLRVYAPGTNETERRELTIAKRWWFGAAMVTLFGEALLASPASGTPTAPLIALAGLAVAWYWLARTRTIRRNTRTLRVAVVMAGGSREVVGDAALFGECRRQLALVDSGASAPQLTPVESEAIWATVYERLDPRLVQAR